MKIGIIGAGYVGATTAYALVMSGVGREIFLVYKNRDRAAVEVENIYHAVPFSHSLKVRVGDYSDLVRF